MSASCAVTTFTDNVAQGSGGGAIRLLSGAVATIANSTFSKNQGFGGGGGVFVQSATATVSDCVFSANIDNVGGAVYGHQSSVTLNNLTLTGNVAFSGANLCVVVQWRGGG